MVLKRRGERYTWLAAVAVLAVLSAASLAVACSRQPAAPGKVVVAVTLLPQAGFVEAVGGDRVEVVVMVPPGASPHTYEVTPDQMVRLSRAKMYAMVGAPVEFELVWMDKLIAANKAMLVVDCSRGIQLIVGEEETHDEDHVDSDGEEEDHHHSGTDPHIWLSVRNAAAMVDNICDGLIQVDPEHAAYYRENCTTYLQELSRLDNELAETLGPLGGQRFIVYHPAFGYFARDYNLIQIAVEQGGNEPDAQYIVRLIDEAREHDIRTIFVAPQVGLRSAEVIAREIGGQVVVMDPLAADYIPNMRAIADAMRQAV